MDSLTIFILGRYSGTCLGFGLYDNFHFGAVLWERLGFGLYDNFHFGGEYSRDTSDLDSLTFFILGGILGHLGFGLYDNFHFGREYSGMPWIWIL